MSADHLSLRPNSIGCWRGRTPVFTAVSLTLLLFLNHFAILPFGLSFSHSFCDCFSTTVYHLLLSPLVIFIQTVSFTLPLVLTNSAMIIRVEGHTPSIVDCSQHLQDSDPYSVASGSTRNRDKVLPTNGCKRNWVVAIPRPSVPPYCMALSKYTDRSTPPRAFLPVNLSRTSHEM